jgi:hypothetical protein
MAFRVLIVTGVAIPSLDLPVRKRLATSPLQRGIFMLDHYKRSDSRRCRQNRSARDSSFVVVERSSTDWGHAIITREAYRMSMNILAPILPE